MPAPDRADISDLARWSFERHYQKYTLRYAQQARAIFRNAPLPLRLNEDEVADALGKWLENDRQWQAYTKSKSHLSDPEKDRLTFVFARRVVYKDFAYIST